MHYGKTLFNRTVTWHLGSNRPPPSDHPQMKTSSLWLQAANQPRHAQKKKGRKTVHGQIPHSLTLIAP